MFLYIRTNIIQIKKKITNKWLSYDEALAKLQKYCAYQDRCHQEVRTKLIEYKVYGDLLEQVMSELIREDFLNEERFAKSYARGKFRMNKWGRNKILTHLKSKRITKYCIRKGLEEIEEEEYMTTLRKVIIVKSKGLSTSDYKGWNKVFQYCMQRGYESELISAIFKELKK